MATQLQELREKPHLSASSVSTYLECGLQWRFKYIDTVEPEFISDSLLFGSSIHSTLEVFNQNRKNGLLPDLDTVQEFFERVWKEKVKATPHLKYTKDNTEESLLEQGKSLLEVFYEELPDTGYEILAVEEPFSLNIPGLSTPIIGVIDLVEIDDTGTVIITDFKTTGRKFSSDEVDKHFQMSLYHLAAVYNGFGTSDIILKLGLFIKTKTPKYEEIFTTRFRDDHQKILNTIKSVSEGIEKGVYIPNTNSWRCKNCEYASACNDFLTTNHS
jgi:putative RecB family exonuclease